jgi:hypothetical protein
VLQGTTVSESNVSWFTDTYFPAPGYEDVTAAESYTSLGSPSPGALAPPTHAAISVSTMRMGRKASSPAALLMDSDDDKPAFDAGVVMVLDAGGDSGAPPPPVFSEFRASLSQE